VQAFIEALKWWYVFQSDIHHKEGRICDTLKTNIEANIQQDIKIDRPVQTKNRRKKVW
jgi:hypothetical protein